MQQRARQAQVAGNRWSPLRTDERPVSEAAHLAFWVAVSGGADDEIIGTVGLRRVGDSETAGSDTAEESCLPWAEDWVRSGDVGEVRRMRVAPEWRRHGVGTALMQHLTRHAHQVLEFHRLVLNTTSAQRPALTLYEKLGFQELERSYLGPYELIWLHQFREWVNGEA
jgi:GNAT superfamily N-acetyltransferase